MTIRPYTNADLHAVVDLFTASVHDLAVDHYDAAQRDAWAPTSPDVEYWRERLRQPHTIVAEIDGEIAGFIAYEENGHIGLLYTSPRHARKGVAATLYQVVESALVSKVDALFTEASLVARPFFESQGFEVVEEEVVERRGALLRRFAMRKIL